MFQHIQSFLTICTFNRFCFILWLSIRKNMNWLEKIFWCYCIEFVYVILKTEVEWYMIKNNLPQYMKIIKVHFLYHIKFYQNRYKTSLFVLNSIKEKNNWMDISCFEKRGTIMSYFQINPLMSFYFSYPLLFDQNFDVEIALHNEMITIYKIIFHIISCHICFRAYYSCRRFLALSLSLSLALYLRTLL